MVLRFQSNKDAIRLFIVAHLVTRTAIGDFVSIRQGQVHVDRKSSIGIVNQHYQLPAYFFDPRNFES